MRYSIILVLLAISISSCQYGKTNRRHHLVQNEYPKYEPIIIKDALICANAGGLLVKPLEINRDSIFNVFIRAFQKLSLGFVVSTGKIYCNRDFIAFRSVKYRRFNFAELTFLLGSDTNLVLIPIINYNYIPRRNIYITSTGAAGGGGFTKNAHVDLAILIFRNKELIYFKSREFFSPLVLTDYSSDNIDISIKQENIDTLVQLTMKDYLERMK